MMINLGNKKVIVFQSWDETDTFGLYKRCHFCFVKYKVTKEEEE